MPALLAAGAAAIEPTIFVSIPSFRDHECADTLADLFAKADRPQNIYVGTCEQNLELGEACVDGRLGAHAARVRRILLNATEARGPTYARYLASSLYRGESFYLQLDSHNRFVRGWDARLLRMHAALPDPDRAVISTYPVGWTDEHNATLTPVMCISRFGEDGMVILHSNWEPPTDAPREQPFIAAGFLFAPGRAILDCPLDPDLPELFHGEELLYSVRLWTHGYRFWAPSENVLFHHYQRPDMKQWWSRDAAWSVRQVATHAKVQLLLAGGLPGYRYGFGRARSLQQYWDFARMDMVARTSDAAAAFCNQKPGSLTGVTIRQLTTCWAWLLACGWDVRAVQANAAAAAATLEVQGMLQEVPFGDQGQFVVTAALRRGLWGERGCVGPCAPCGLVRAALPRAQGPASASLGPPHPPLQPRCLPPLPARLLRSLSAPCAPPRSAAMRAWRRRSGPRCSGPPGAPRALVQPAPLAAAPWP